MAIWQGVGLQVLKTTSPDYLYLDVETSLHKRITPFTKLEEMKAIKHDKVSGWLFPTKLWKRLRPFIEQLQRLPQQLYELKRKPGRAARIYIPQPVERALVLLIAPSPLLKAVMEKTWTNIDFLSWTTNPEESKGEIEGQPEEDFRSSSHFLGLVSRFLEAIQAKILIGDILRFEAELPHSHQNIVERNALTYIYDGSTFVNLLRGIDTGDLPPITEYGVVPKEFQCPAPFPIMYWVGVVDDPETDNTLIVWPNFEQFLSVMEYDVDAPEINSGYIRGFLDNTELRIALRFTHEKTTYYIYFEPLPDEVLTYERLIQGIDDESTRYFAHSDTAIIASLQKPS